MCSQAVSSVVKLELTCSSTAATSFGVLHTLFQVLLNENQRVAQLLHLFWCAARLFQVLLNENEIVAQLLQFLWCADRLFNCWSNENQHVAQLLHLFWFAGRLCQVLLNENCTCSSTPAILVLLTGCFKFVKQNQL